MNDFLNRTSSFINTLQSKIVFYPALLAFFGVFFAFFMIFLEGRGITGFFNDHLPQLMVNSGDTAMALLTVCIGGLISMMVFSFSMVMVLLNQAANNYSPRLLPGLISDKKHQIILGIYFSSILYCIFTLFSIQPSEDTYQLPGFSILIGILFTVICLCAFVYFIHNISQRIQINNILDHIFFTAKRRMEHLIEEENISAEDNFPETEDWHTYNSENSNYLQNISKKNLLEICKKEKIQLRIIPVKGDFVLKGLPMFKSSKKLKKDTIKRILSNFNYSKEELIADNYILGFKQITEIIVKAMSPAVNDPGTAINGIDYLSELFALRMQRHDTEIISEEGTAYLRLATIDFEELLYNVMASIRTYCLHDIVLVQKLSLMFLYLQKQEALEEKYHAVVEKEVDIFIDAVQDSISNKDDRKVFEEYKIKLKRTF